MESHICSGNLILVVGYTVPTFNASLYTMGQFAAVDFGLVNYGAGHFKSAHYLPISSLVQCS